VLAPAGERGGQPDKMPRLVTDSGYVEIEDVRRLVGREAPQPQSLMLLDLQTRQQFPIALDALRGRDSDPLAVLTTTRIAGLLASMRRHKLPRRYTD